MFNVYAQRATRPDDMDRELNRELHEENMAAFRYILSNVAQGFPGNRAAWGYDHRKAPLPPRAAWRGSLLRFLGSWALCRRSSASSR